MAGKGNGTEMIDWGLVAKIAGGGFGSTILILAILCIVVWLIGFVIQRRAKKAEGEENPTRK